MKTIVFLIMCSMAISLNAQQKSQFQSVLQVNYLKQLENDMTSFQAGNFVSTMVDTNTVALILVKSFVTDFIELCSVQKGNIQKEMISSLELLFVKSGKTDKMSKDVRSSYKKLFCAFAELVSKNQTTLQQSQDLLKWWVSQNGNEVQKALKTLVNQYQKDLNTLISVK